LKLAGKIVNNTDDSMNGSLKAFISGIAITLTNPLTIFAVLAVIATFGNLDTRLDATILVAGVFFGAAAWWLALSGGISLVRCHFTESRILLINRITAVLLAGLAVWAIISGGKHLMLLFGA
jgi:threonine/homoserine/homoserine lactone efflux protein